MFIIIIIVTFGGQEGCNIKVFSMPGQTNIHYYIASHFFFLCFAKLKTYSFLCFPFTCVMNSLNTTHFDLEVSER